jgi:ribonuclease R
MESEILSLLRRKKGGLSLHKIASELHLLKGEKIKLRKSLTELEKRGVLLKLNKKYFVRPRSKFVRGKLISIHRGFGFVSPEGELSEDIFIPSRYSAGAVQGDRVEVLVKDKGRKGKPEGKVTRILNKERKTLLGFFRERHGQSYFLPFDALSDEEIPVKWERGFPPKSEIIVEVDRKTLRLKQVLGKPDDPGVDTRVVMQRYSLSSSFSKEALEEAEGIIERIVPYERRKRKDYRNWSTVTIDGEGAQDFDDAVSIKRLSNGSYHLGVHISDVSYYVKPDSSLDREAYSRATSIYFPDLTLPMLPEKLSNNVCSLRPRKERLTLSVVLEIDEEGNVLKSAFHPSVIQTEARMTYSSVFKILSGDKGEQDLYPTLVENFLLMRDLAHLLREKRVKQGSLDFDLVEPELVYREGKLHSVLPSERNEAHRIIEEFMLAANEAVASFLTKKNIPILFRIHPPPSIEGIKRLRDILLQFGISLPTGQKARSKDLQLVQKQVEGRPEEKFIGLQILKSLKVARYSQKNEGHYGLAKKYYSHFTSPIRRYPDLVVHRILKQTMGEEEVDIPSLSSLSIHCSEQERNSEEAERELLEWRIFRLLKTMLGEEFDGIIVYISRAGLSVELKNYFVEGLIPRSELKGHFSIQKGGGVLKGRTAGQIFELGSSIRVMLVSCDSFRRRMSLALSP